MKVVVDTNVLVAADGGGGPELDPCRRNCILALARVQKSGIVVIDDRWLILGEYSGNLANAPKSGLGRKFWKWILQNSQNRKHVEQVTVTDGPDGTYREFADDRLQGEFDRADRKFVAVAKAASGEDEHERVAILQALDSKWLLWFQRLEELGISVKFLCPDAAHRFAQRKHKKPYRELGLSVADIPTLQP